MNSKHRCRNCKEYYDVDEDTPKYQRWCSSDCQYELAMKELIKIKERAQRASLKAVNRRKKYTKTLKKHWGLDLNIRKNAAKNACHRYIKLRDKGLNCICCNKPLRKKYHSGHFLESGNYPFIRYNEDNINSQRVDCNMFKGGDSGHYRVNLVKKIGLERVEWLEHNKSKTIKRTSDDYRVIENHFKKLIKGLL